MKAITSWTPVRRSRSKLLLQQKVYCVYHRCNPNSAVLFSAFVAVTYDVLTSKKKMKWRLNTTQQKTKFVFKCKPRYIWLCISTGNIQNWISNFTARRINCIILVDVIGIKGNPKYKRRSTTQINDDDEKKNERGKTAERSHALTKFVWFFHLREGSLNNDYARG